MRRQKIIIIAVLALIAAAWFAAPQGKKLAELKNMKGTAALSWNPGDDTVAGHKIYYGTSPRDGDCPPAGYERNVTTGKDANYTLNDLDPGRTWYFSVSALNAAGKESCFSEEMKKEIPSASKLFLENLWTKVKGGKK